jgi:type IV pilus assembly protein PilF
MGRLAGALLIVTLAGCSVTATGPLDADELREAARINAEIATHHLDNGNLARARQKIDRALEQDPALVDAHLVAAAIDLELDRETSAGRHYQKALRLEQDNPRVLNNYAAYLCRRDQRQRALDLWELAAADRLYDQRAMALANAGRCLADAGAWSSAAGYWRRALRIDGGFAPALRGMSEYQLEAGQVDAAARWFSRYTAAGKESPSMLWLGVRIARAANDADRLSQLTRRLRERFPASEQAARLME